MMGQDVEQVYHISAQAFSQSWSQEALQKEVSNPVASYFVAEDNGQIVGYAGMWQVIDEGEVINIAVRKEDRRKGLGEALLKKLLQEAEIRQIINVFLEVRESNIPALNLYTSMGFKVIGRRKDYYHEPTEDGINMQYIL